MISLNFSEFKHSSELFFFFFCGFVINDISFGFSTWIFYVHRCNCVFVSVCLFVLIDIFLFFLLLLAQPEHIIHNTHDVSSFSLFLFLLLMLMLLSLALVFFFKIKKFSQLAIAGVQSSMPFEVNGRKLFSRRHAMKPSAIRWEIALDGLHFDRGNFYSSWTIRE